MPLHARGFDDAAERGSIFAVGRNCSSVSRAQRVALLVDGEEYFRAFAMAAERAERSIAILAWDFHSGTYLHYDKDVREPPAQLGDFLNWLARRRRSLRVYVLDWDYPLVFGTDREFRPLYGFGWRPHRRVHVAYDNTHPLTASHHQKIVVIDDALAFVGGFDLTVRRWDTCSHAADEARRRFGDVAYPPFHDLMMAVDGEPARQLGAIVRQRWRAATHHSLPEPPHAKHADATWPERLRVDLRDVDVALARTLPELPETDGVTEVKALYLDMIAAARRYIYIENQYFTSHHVGEALAKRLSEPDCPEIVVVVRLFSHGWLEEHTMHVLRTRLVRRLRSADRQGRFHVYYPHLDGLAEKICIDLHSKLMIVDDEILRIGSSNLSNRSMSLDSECDAAIEARGNPRISSVIREFRNRLLAEHLDVEPSAVEAEVHRGGSLSGMIESLGGRSRTLRPLEHQPQWPEAVIELASVGDPGQSVSLDGLIDEFTPERFLSADPTDDEPDDRGGGNPSESKPRSVAARFRRNPALRARLLRLAALVVTFGALAALWRYTPLAAWVDASRITAWAEEFADRPWAPLVVLGAYTPACVLMFPRALITLAAVVAFGPKLGFVYALSGIAVAALASYIAGLAVPRHSVLKLGGERLLHVADTLRRRSLVAMTALRLVPLAPFVVEGLFAAAIGIRLLPFMFGTIFGMLPGTLATTIFGDQLEAALEDPSRINYGVISAVILALVVLTLIVRRWLVMQHRKHDHAAR